MTAILALIPWPWRIAIGAVALLLIGGAFGAGAVVGYSAGYDTAKAKGEAEVSRLMADYHKRAAEAAQAFSDNLLAQTRKALEANANLAQEKEAHAKTARTLQNRIAEVTRNSTHRFSPDFVRLFNEAVGAVAVDGDESGRTDTAGTAQGTGSGSSACAGVQRAAVTERDVLSHIVYYGKRTRDLEAQLRGLIRVAEDRQ